MVNLEHKDEVGITRFLIGYALGQIQSFLDQESVVITTEETADRVSDLLSKAVEFRLAYELIKHPGITHYPIEVRRDPSSTKLVMGFEHENGEWEEAPMFIQLNFYRN